MTIGDPYSFLELIGTIAFAVSGGAVAARAGMDWLGIAVLAVVTAVGGGTVRDLLLGRHPVGWIPDPRPIWVALATSIVMIAEAYRPTTLQAASSRRCGTRAVLARGHPWRSATPVGGGGTGGR